MRMILLYSTYACITKRYSIPLLCWRLKQFKIHVTKTVPKEARHSKDKRQVEADEKAWIYKIRAIPYIFICKIFNLFTSIKFSGINHFYCTLAASWILSLRIRSGFRQGYDPDPASNIMDRIRILLLLMDRIRSNIWPCRILHIKNRPQCNYFSWQVYHGIGREALDKPTASSEEINLFICSWLDVSWFSNGIIRGWQDSGQIRSTWEFYYWIRLEKKDINI